MKQINTVIFDMDGVLVDSEPIILRAAKEALAMYGISVPHAAFQKFIGAGEENFITAPGRAYHKSEAEIEHMLRTMYALYDQYVSSLTVHAHAPEVVSALHRMGITLALVSSSAKHKLTVTLSAAGIPDSCFSLILSGSDVTRRKPDPMPYRMATKRLGKRPDECLVIEDALTGIASAKAAGLSCAAVTTSFDKEALLRAGADTVIDTLSEIIAIVTEG